LKRTIMEQTPQTPDLTRRTTPTAKIQWATFSSGLARSVLRLHNNIDQQRIT
jgi:hypothetical protein